MAKEFNCGKMGPSTRANGGMGERTAPEHFFMPMVISTRDCSRGIKLMDLGSTLTVLASNILANGLIMKDTEME